MGKVEELLQLEHEEAAGNAQPTPSDFATGEDGGARWSIPRMLLFGLAVSALLWLAIVAAYFLI